jgi:threonylcarbamoyladenosine tRNA methylthiotransferase MtaB
VTDLRPTRPRIRILTLGCKVNQCDSEELARALAAQGYEVAGRGRAADLYVVNTCTVTGVADAKARKLIRKLAREHPGARIVVTGCLVQRAPENAPDLPQVVAVVPNAEKPRLPEVIAALLPAAPVAAADLLPSRTRAFVKLQDGCDHRCAYCAVPDARGPMWSKPFDEALAEVSRLAAAGVPEVVLCGIRLGAYGRGGPSGAQPCAPTCGLAAFVHELRRLPIPRLRLSSIEPMDIDEALLAEIADHPTLCRHLHLPLQSGDDEVLRAMRRSYRAADFARLMGRVREGWPEAAISADVVVGFPGETEQQFRHTLDFLRAQRFSRVHVFPFSPRPGTPAAEMEPVPAPVRHARTEAALALAATLAQEAAAAWVGRPVRVLFEQRGRDGVLTGLTEHYVRVHTAGPAEWVGRIVEVTPRRAEGGELHG